MTVHYGYPDPDAETQEQTQPAPALALPPGQTLKGRIEAVLFMRQAKSPGPDTQPG